jgi:hypothetical protein
MMFLIDFLMIFWRAFVEILLSSHTLYTICTKQDALLAVPILKS